MQYLTKRNVIIVVVLLIIAAGATIGIVALVNFLNLRNVNFKLSATVDSATIYTDYGSDDKTPNIIKVLTNDSTVQLSDGNYQIIPTGENISTSPIDFTIDQNTKTVSINPPFSDRYLSEMLGSGQKITIDVGSGVVANIPTDLSLIHGVIKTKYADIIDNYDIKPGQLLSDGSWYITEIWSPEAGPRVVGFDIFKIILHFDNIWEIAAPPSLAFRYDDYPDIPGDVIYEANQL
jgi:hypothetical protein